ncbi:hypothetical protein [Lentzea sp. NPDC055074]
MSGQRNVGPDDVRLAARRLREVIRLMPLSVRVESADDLGVLAGVFEGLGVLTLRSLVPPQRIALTRLCDSVLAGCSQAQTAGDESSRNAAFRELRQSVGEARHVVDTLIESLSRQASEPVRHSELSALEKSRLIVEHEAELDGLRRPDAKRLEVASGAEIADLYVMPARPGAGTPAEPSREVPIVSIAAHLSSLQVLEQAEHSAATRRWNQSTRLVWAALIAAVGIYLWKGTSPGIVVVQLTVVGGLGLMSTRCLREYHAHRREQLKCRYVRTLLEKTPVVAGGIIELVGTSSPDPETTRRIVEEWMKEATATDPAAAPEAEPTAVIGLIKEILERLRPGKAAG